MRNVIFLLTIVCLLLSSTFSFGQNTSFLSKTSTQNYINNQMTEMQNLLKSVMSEAAFSNFSQYIAQAMNDAQSGAYAISIDITLEVVYEYQTTSTNSNMLSGHLALVNDFKHPIYYPFLLNGDGSFVENPYVSLSRIAANQVDLSEESWVLSEVIPYQMPVSSLGDWGFRVGFPID